jgi:predicted ATP-grasp superfamily ATP-dependent carboligase
MPSRTLILIGQRRRLLLPVLQAALACGFTQRVVLGTQETRRLRWSTACSRHVLVDADDAGAVLRCLQVLAREFPDAVVAPGDCEATCLLDRLRGQLPLRTIPVASAATIDVLDDKAAFHRFCTSHGLPVPPSVVVPAREALHFDHLAGAVGVPFVVKPTRGSGSVGVVVVRSAPELEKRVLDDPGYPPGPLIVQRFVPGTDIDVDLVAVRGRVQALAVHRVDRHTMSFGRHPALEAAAETLCRLSGYSGPMNIDARVDAGTGDVFLIESNPRFWASLTAPLACGMNFVQETLAEDEGTEPHVLGSGQADTRHPALRPRTWWPLLCDRSDRGRLLRAAALDPYALVLVAAELPAIAARLVRRAALGLGRLLHLAAARTAH